MPPPSPRGCQIEAACTRGQNHQETWLLAQMRPSGPQPENTVDGNVCMIQVLEFLLLHLTAVVQLVTFQGLTWMGLRDRPHTSRWFVYLFQVDKHRYLEASSGQHYRIPAGRRAPVSWQRLPWMPVWLVWKRERYRPVLAASTDATSNKGHA